MKTELALLRVLFGSGLAGICLSWAPAAVSGEIISANFDGGVFPPAGWTVLNPAAGPVAWELNTTVGAANQTGGTGAAAMIDSLEFPRQAYDSSLVTPAISLPATGEARLLFQTHLETWSGDEIADVDMSLNGGTIWTNLRRSRDVQYLDGPISILVSAPGQQAMFRWRYYNLSPQAWDMFWQIDDVQLAALGPGDSNADGRVNDADLSLLLANWGRNVGWDKGNFNGDATVNDADLSLMLANWSAAGAGSSLAVVPEPVTLTILAFGAAVFLSRK